MAACSRRPKPPASPWSIRCSSPWSIYREIDLAELWQVIVSSVYLIAQILIIVTGAGVYSWLMTTSGIPQKLIGAITAMHLPHWQTLLFVNAGLLVAGSFLEPPAAILILTPLLLPVVEAAGINALHFGIIMAVNLSIGLYMPPFGLNLFAARAIFNVPMGMIYRGVLPFVVVNFLALLGDHLRAGDLDGADRRSALARIPKACELGGCHA